MGVMHAQFALVFCLIGISSSNNTCPKQCICDIRHRLKSVSCRGHNVADTNLEVPQIVQIYDLSNNSILKLEDNCFEKMKLRSIIELNLSSNKISWIALNAFAGLEKLTSLNLSHNRIEYLSQDLFSFYNKKLLSLDLSRNKFSQLKNQPFLIHKNLKVLKLQNSQISSLPTLTFSELPQLEYLDLSDNYMSTLSEAVISPLNNVKTLILANNQWNCDKTLIDLEMRIFSKGLDHSNLCTRSVKDIPKRSEKMILQEPIEQDREAFIEIKDIQVRGEDEYKDNDITTYLDLYEITFIDKYNSKVPSFWSLIAGLELGLIFGIVGTYCLLKCRCNEINLRRRRQRRHRHEYDGQARLLQGTPMYATVDTPPIVRRQLSNNEPTCRSVSWEAGPIYVPGHRVVPAEDNNAQRCSRIRSDSPPPPYRECLQDTVIN